MFDFQRLSKWSWEQIVECFVESFADYIVEVNPNVDYVKARSRAARVDLDLSIGAIDSDGKLCGLMLMGVDDWQDRKTAFNVGTGVVPASRGNRLVTLMYEWLMPRFRHVHIEQLGLEVIQTNERAVAAYRRAGFAVTREFDCYTGNVRSDLVLSSDHEIRFPEAPDWESYRQLEGFPVSWEHVPSAIQLQPAMVTIEAYQQDELIGYAVFNPETGAVPQIRFRDSDAGKTLLAALDQRTDQLKLNNILSSHQHTTRLLDAVGLECPLKQFEMWREI